VLPRCSNTFWVPKYTTPRAAVHAAKHYLTIFLVSSALSSIRKPSDCQPPLAANLGLIGFPWVIGVSEFRMLQVRTAKSCCGPKPWFGTQARPPSSSLSSSVQSGRFSRLATNPEPHRTPYRRAGTRRPLSRATWVSMDEPCIAQGEVT